MDALHGGWGLLLSQRSDQQCPHEQNYHSVQYIQTCSFAISSSPQIPNISRWDEAQYCGSIWLLFCSCILSFRNTEGRETNGKKHLVILWLTFIRVIAPVLLMSWISLQMSESISHRWRVTRLLWCRMSAMGQAYSIVQNIVSYRLLCIWMSAFQVKTTEEQLHSSLRKKILERTRKANDLSI